MNHKRTFFFLEQLILKHNAHEQVSYIHATRRHTILMVDLIY